jgi:two-component system, chemotaxis family, chemotaxis protein CheY
MTEAMRPTVLIVDDSPTMRGMIRKALTEGGCQVLEAHDGVEGLEMLQSAQIQAILTDINMPRMDGLAFIRAVRQDARFARVPILALTTEGEADVKAAGKDAGATGWIVKPFDPKQLCEVLGMVVRRAASLNRPPSNEKPEGA